MAFQPQAEKDAERQLIINFAKKLRGRVVMLQEDNDDGKTDGIVEFGSDNKQLNVEARRKGYPNHSGKASAFKDGWDTYFLQKGIYLNELTIKNYKNRSFVFIVDIKGCKPRAAAINSARVDELLQQPHMEERSTNSGNMQSVKTVPLSWFVEY